MAVRTNVGPMSVRAVLLAALVVLAGCVAGSPESFVTGGDGPANETASVDADNPWGERTLSVAVEAPSGDDRDNEPLVRRALGYWTANAEAYAGYQVSFRLVDDAFDADVVVEFVREVTGCDDVDEAAGCAPHVTAQSEVDRPMRLEVLTGLDDDSTVLVLKHELGHVLGLGHDDDPAEIMSASERLATLPKPNATDRSIPWRSDTLTVYVDYRNVSSDDRRGVREQIRRALDYYERGAEGRAEGTLSFEFTRDRSRADVVITFPDEPPCATGAGSCGYRYGTDTDGDASPEWYTTVEIAVAGIDTEAVGWHVGYWLGYALGFTEPSDWPDVFRQASAEERRSDWWANATGERVDAVAPVAPAG
jgi:hypothetical protein